MLIRIRFAIYFNTVETETTFNYKVNFYTS